MLSYTLYQMKHEPELNEIRFAPFYELEEESLLFNIHQGNYDLVWRGYIAGQDEMDIMDILENLFFQFNVSRPEGFTGHSMSVSDVIVLNDKPYYVDSFGFRELDADAWKGGE